MQRLSTLEEIHAALWRELAGCVADRRHPWRTPVLATVAGSGDMAGADARIVVLREVRQDTRELLLYTDDRSDKATQARAHPQGTLVMWSPALSWQLRCRVHLRVEDSGIAVTSRWARIRTSAAAHDYLSPLPPGAPLDMVAGPAARREHFAVITATVATVTEMDWLELHPDGHRRASFSPQGRWLQP
jgi:pyridoxamine 5'-phosphate oxidase